MSGRAGFKKQGKVGVCIMCRQVFQTSRSDKKTCSGKCRKSWERYNKREKIKANMPMLGTSQEERLALLINKTLGNMKGLR